MKLLGQRGSSPSKWLCSGKIKDSNPTLNYSYNIIILLHNHILYYLESNFALVKLSQMNSLRWSESMSAGDLKHHKKDEARENKENDIQYKLTN